MAQVVLGTAGHIDHGKTSLVKALTGTNTDRLAEEKKRGNLPLPPKKNIFLKKKTYKLSVC